MRFLVVVACAKNNHGKRRDVFAHQRLTAYNICFPSVLQVWYCSAAPTPPTPLVVYLSKVVFFIWCEGIKRGIFLPTGVLL